MEIKNNIQDKIDCTINIIDTIETVNVPHFFKDKTMQRLFSQKEVQQTKWNWFTPKLQLATLVCVVVLNVIAFTNLNKSVYNENVDEFAETYGLSTSTENSILN